MSKNLFINTIISYRQSLLNLVGKIAPPDEVEDIVQDAYVKICQVKNNNSLEYPKAFLYKIAVNLAKDFNKKSEVRLADSAEDESDYGVETSDKVFHEIQIEEEFGHLCEAVKRLPVQCRKVFVLRKIYGFSHKEIASELKLSPHTVESHIANAMRKCEDYNDSLEKAKVETSKVKTALGKG